MEHSLVGERRGQSGLGGTILAAQAVPIALLRRAVAAKPESAEFRYRLAYALAERGEYDEFAHVFREAFSLWSQEMEPTPEHWPAVGGREAAEKLRRNARALIERGVTATPVLGALALAEGVLGNRAAVTEVLGAERFFRRISGVVPPGWQEEEFFVSLGAEIQARARLFLPHENHVMRQASRVDQVLRSEQPATRALRQELARRVRSYLRELGKGGDHPYLRARPTDITFYSWAILTHDEGHLAPHLHPSGWANGVYYVRRPAGAAKGDADGGLLRLGPPPSLGIAEEVWPTQTVEPEPGTLLLMPAYYYHATTPTRVREERICVAFDVGAEAG
jgi:hypothetical protein